VDRPRRRHRRPRRDHRRHRDLPLPHRDPGRRRHDRRRPRSHDRPDEPGRPRLNRIDPPPLENSVGHDIKVAPVNVAISPDGRHIAYTYSHYSCPVGTICAVRSVTGYTRADRLTDPEPYGTSYLDDPYWLTDTRTVQGGGTGITVNLQDLGHDTVQWFSDYDTGAEAEDLSDPAVSVQAGLYAAVRGYDETTHIAWYDLNGDPLTGAPPAAPSRKCVTSYDETLSDPTFSADGTVLAWAEGEDVWATTDPTRCDHQPQVWLRDASEPSFSPARYVVPAPHNTARPTYRVTRADRGHRLAVAVTARGTGGTTRVVSTAVTVRNR
jgi:hypothetical protein